MNKEWSELNKKLQVQIRKESTFQEGKETLLTLRQHLTKEWYQFRTDLKREEFNAMPFINAKGFHNKTVAYSIWHVFRIEDIVAHTLMNQDEQILFSEDFQKRIGSPMITTGNELVKQQIADFSEKLELNELYQYATTVMDSTNKIIENLTYPELKRKISDAEKEKLGTLQVVSEDENAFWLIDYWCGKDVKGLLQMPFSRHWVMHLEACLRIKNKLTAKR